jgi:Kef-type K+ transport system membrane component KefB
MLGADIGTAVMAVVFSFDLSWLSPLCIFIGVTLFILRQGTPVGDVGRVLIGLGLMLLALQLVSQATHVLTANAAVQLMLESLTSDRMLEILVGATLAVLSYSSLAVVLLTTMAYGLKLSPLLAALAFGIVARERRVHLTNAQRGFGTAGDLLTLFLFVYIASLLDWSELHTGVWLGLALIAARTASMVVCNVAAARLSGSTERMGLLTGLALTPMSAFAILLLEQSRLQGFEPARQVLATLAFMMLLQELLGPLVTQRALKAAAETHLTQE